MRLMEMCCQICGEGYEEKDVCVEQRRLYGGTLCKRCWEERAPLLVVAR